MYLLFTSDLLVLLLLGAGVVASLYIQGQDWASLLGYWPYYAYGIH